MFGSGRISRLAGVGIAGLVVSGTLGGLGVAGALPAPVRDSVADVAHAVGIDLITPDAPRRADRALVTASSGVDDAVTRSLIRAETEVTEATTTTTMPANEVAAEHANEAERQSASSSSKSSSASQNGTRGRNRRGGGSDSSGAQTSSS